MAKFLGGSNLNIRKDVINICAYYFEVLVHNYLELEEAIHKQSGLLFLFKKIDFLDRAKAFNGLLERAHEADEQLQLYNDYKGDYELNALIQKLTECLALYMNMVNVQININKMLKQKANGLKYDWNEYSSSLKYLNTLRDALENELPNLQSLYGTVIYKM